MCLVHLNVATQPCNHRWYRLVRPCEPVNNLSNCPQRLQLQGMENRIDVCPFCYGSSETIQESTHRLFGSNPSNQSSVSSAPTSPDIPGMTRSSRSNSNVTLSTLSRHSSTSSAADYDRRGEKHREMNDRLLVYLTTDPHEVLPSAKKNYPTYPSLQARDESSSSTSASDPNSLLARRTYDGLSGARGVFARGWRSGVRLGKGVSRASPSSSSSWVIFE